MIKFRRNCKRGEGRSQGTEGARKQGNSLACENFATKIAPLRNKPPSMKPFRSPKTTLCEIFRSRKTLPRHTCAISQPKYPFCSCETLQSPILQPQAPSAKSFCNYETLSWHTSAISLLQNGRWNHPLPAKSPIGCEMGLLLRKA